MDRRAAEGAYDTYHGVFSFPPRVGRKGPQDVLDIIQREKGRPKTDADLNRIVDESVLDDLEREGFFARLESKNRPR